MKKRFTLVVITVLLAVISANALPAGQTPTAGNTYYIYNVGQGKYLANDGDGGLTLSGEGMAITLSAVESGSGNFFMTSTTGKLGTSVLDAVTCNGTAQYDQWKFTSLNSTDKIYNISCRLSESNAYYYLYWSNLLDNVTRILFMPYPDYTDARWIFVSQSDYESNAVTLDEAATSYTKPAKSNATVRVIRTFTLNSWNTFCVPFDISNAQLQSAFGISTVAEFTGCDETTLKFTSKSSVTAGTPYLIKPAKAAANGYYEFTGISEFVDAPTSVVQSPCTFVSSFYKTTAPSGAYVLRNNEVYHLTSSMDMKGFRGYFVENASSAKISKWTLDGETTGIESINADGTAKADVIYSIDGCRITNGTKLQKGVYIVNGKKVIIK
jgi:hypothetical protein